MKHLSDLLTLRYRHLLFHSPVRLSVCQHLCRSSTLMSVRILNNYKTKQPSNLAWNISLTSWLCDIGILFSVCLFVHPSVHLSTFMSKFDIYVKVSILINYKTNQPSNLAWNISLTSWLCNIGIPFSIRSSACPSVHLNIYLKVCHLRQSILINYNSTTTIIPCMTHLPDLLTLTHFTSMFDISSIIRPTTIKPCKVLLLNVLTRHIPWPGDLDLYFGCSDFDIIYVNVPDLLKCKTSSHQTLHSASPRCTDSARILTQWPWPIFCTPVPFTHFMSTFNISSTIRPTTTKPCVVLLLNVQTPQIPWLGDLDLYFALH